MDHSYSTLEQDPQERSKGIVHSIWASFLINILEERSEGVARREGVHCIPTGHIFFCLIGVIFVSEAANHVI